jgi:hypothetical protein
MKFLKLLSEYWLGIAVLALIAWVFASSAGNPVHPDLLDDARSESAFENRGR